ncbi:MAG: metallophosphoesterase [candidate division WOR-3 bacterium]
MHFSDTHLGRIKYGISESRQDYINAFYEVIELSKEEKPDIIIHSGDLFDNKTPDPLIMRDVFSKIIEVSKDMKFLIIPGNHDFSARTRLSPISILTLSSDNIKVVEHRDILNSDGTINVEKLKFSFDGINFYLLPYFHNSDVLRRVFPQILESINVSEINFLVMHQIVDQEALYKKLKNKSLIQVDIPIEDLKLFDFVFLGHFHMPYLNENLKFGYAGSTEALSYDEYEYDDNGFIKDNTKKRVFIYEILNKFEIKKKYLILKTPRKYIKVELKDPSIQDIENNLKNLEDKEAILILKIDELNSEILPELKSILSRFKEKKKFYHIKDNVSVIKPTIQFGSSLSYVQDCERIKLGDYYELIKRIELECENFEDKNDRQERIKRMLEESYDIKKYQN